MATRLKDTDVVIIGLGAVGGVAALPLAQAGLEVIGLEAGTWLTKRDFAPDELRNNYRGWPQAVQKANQEIPTSRATASSPTGPRGNLHPMQNAVGGTSLHYWAQSWRLNPWDFKVVSETTRRGQHFLLCRIHLGEANGTLDLEIVAQHVGSALGHVGEDLFADGRLRALEGGDKTRRRHFAQ